MKRKIVFVIIVACFAAVSFGQRRARTAVQKIIQLTKPATADGMSFQEALSKLRSVPRFTGQVVDRTVISQLAWAGLGNRQTPEMAQIIPQPMQSYTPTQLFFATNEGVFFYQPVNNSLEQLVDRDIRTALAGTVPMPESVTSAGCVIIITSVDIKNAAARRGGSSANVRNAMLLEAGHIAQNIQLQAVCIEGLGSIAISEFEASAVSKACGLPRDVDVLYMVCVGALAEQEKNGNSSNPAVIKRAAIIVPGADFEDTELFDTLNILNQAAIQTIVASNRLGKIIGMNKSAFEVQVLADKIRVDDFDSIIIIGGKGASMFINEPIMGNILREAFQKKKIIGATSFGTSVLASAGILQGIKVTGLVSERINIEKMGAIFVNSPVEKDMPIITCAGPDASKIFAAAIVNAVRGK